MVSGFWMQLNSVTMTIAIVGLSLSHRSNAIPVKMFNCWESVMYL